MIELCNVTLSYESTDILRNINNVFGVNEFTCVIGKNGCGKSTMLRAIAGLSHYNGNILLDGIELITISRKNRAKRISYLPQIRSIATIDVETLIAYGRYPYLGFSKTLTEKDREKIAYAVSVTGMERFLKRSLHTLSGGERQRAYIAMMISQDADIMILDEPTTHLDIEHQIEVMELLKKLHKTGKSIIVAAHDLPQALSYATHVLLIAKGGAIVSGKPYEICENPLLNSTFGVRLKKSLGADELYAYRMTKGV